MLALVSVIGIVPGMLKRPLDGVWVFIDQLAQVAQHLDLVFVGGLGYVLEDVLFGLFEIVRGLLAQGEPAARAEARRTAERGLTLGQSSMSGLLRSVSSSASPYCSRICWLISSSVTWL